MKHRNNAINEERINEEAHAALAPSVACIVRRLFETSFSLAREGSYHFIFIYQ